ncbi:MAG: DUF2147 domain-containing protein [Novosphingobium sp.]|nr:DUF2147 domain-containing protein [Novosphingobium sp.]
MAISFQPADATANSILGSWRTDDGRAIVTISRCGDALCGRISRFLVPEPAGGARDNENPDKKLRKRRLLGVPIFWGLRRDGNLWEGRGYSPQDGRYFKAKLEARNSRLNIKGCVAFFCKTKVWKPGS